MSNNDKLYRPNIYLITTVIDALYKKYKNNNCT